MRKNLIFLDMDGVISTPRAATVYHEKPHPDLFFDPVAMRMLNLLCDIGEALVVVSSSWRMCYLRDEYETVMRRNGFTGVLHDDWETPIDLKRGFRGQEVLWWLSDHPEFQGNYVILDDDADFYEDQPLVQTDPHNGITLQNFRDALAILLPEEKPLQIWDMTRTGVQRKLEAMEASTVWTSGSVKGR